MKLAILIDWCLAAALCHGDCCHSSGRIVLSAAGAGPSSDPLAKPAPAWQPPSAGAGPVEVFACWRRLKARRRSRTRVAKAEAIWRELPSPASEDELLLRLARTFALVDPNAARLVASAGGRRPAGVPRPAWLRDGRAPPLLANTCGCCTRAGWCTSRCSTRRWTSFRAWRRRRGRPGLAVVLSERRLSRLVEQGIRPEVDRRVAAGRRGQPAPVVALARLMQDDSSG